MSGEKKTALIGGLAALAAGAAYYFLIYRPAKATAAASLDTINQTITSNQVKPSQYEGQLIRGSDSPKVYFIKNGFKQWIHDPDVLAKLGYSFDQVINVSPTVTDAIPTGATLSGLNLKMLYN